MPTWDSTKGAGDGITSEQWNNHVDDQKSRAKHYIQETEPSNPAEGDLWSTISRSSFERNWEKLTDVNKKGIDATDTAVYAGGSDNTVHKFNRDDGSEQWTHSLHSNAINGVSALNGTVYSGGDGNTVFAANSSDGSKSWDHTLHSNSVRSVEASNGTVYSGGADNTVYAVDPSDGSQQWSHSLHSSTVNGLYEADGVLYSASDDGSVIAADASDGSEIWTHNLHGGDVDDVSVTNGVVYSAGGTNAENVVAADTSDGSEIWTKSESDTVKSIASADNVVYCGLFNGETVSIDNSDGSDIWRQSYHNNVISSLADYDGYLYIAEYNPAVMEIDDVNALEKKGYHNGTWLEFV